jgi:hypothetical protein
MLGTEPHAAATHDRMSVGERVDCLVPLRSKNEPRTHGGEVRTAHYIRQQVAEPELDVVVGEEDVREPVHRGKDARWRASRQTRS